jgi:hypothetical protein
LDRNEKSRVTIEIYDADGDLRESLGGEYTFRQIRSMMKDIINNDGIPVIRQLGKHAKVEKNMIGDAMLDKLPDLKDICEKVLKDYKPDGAGKKMDLPNFDPIPMVLEYKFDGIEFRAAGNPLDVHCANEALLKRVFEE